MNSKPRVWRAYGLMFLVSLAGASHADDLNPPTWRLGNATATVQEWDFDTSTLPLAPDGSTWGSGGSGYVNPYGTPLLSANSTASWASGGLGRTGLYVYGPNGADFTDFVIPNDPGGSGNKDMWIQLTANQFGTEFNPTVLISSSVFNGPATFVQKTQPDSNGWIHYTFSVSMTGCPSVETARITDLSQFSMAVDQVVIDTICNPVPEPMSLLSLGVGVVMAMARVRSRRVLPH